MIQTKVKCDCAGGHYYRTAPEVELYQAVSEQWWEISTGVIGAIIISQPDSVPAFKCVAKHACSVECARKIFAEIAEELIQEKVEVLPLEKEAEV
jgi:hypothetical protein